MRRRLVGILLLVALALSACETGVRTHVDLRPEGLEGASVSVELDGVIAEVVAADTEHQANIAEVFRSRLGAEVDTRQTANDDGRVIHYTFETVERVDVGKVVEAGGVSGVGAVTRNDNQVIVTLVEPTELKEALAEAAGDDESLLETMFDTTYVEVSVSLEDEATLVEGDGAYVIPQSSQVTVLRPLAEVGAATWRFEVAKDDVNTLWVAAALIALAGAGYVVLSQRGRGSRSKQVPIDGWVR